MQDVTDLPFMSLISGYGNAGVYFTEYFRVLPESRLDPQILASITQNPTGRPVIAQMIGNDMALDPGIGTCGKSGQGVPVGVGQPTLLIDGLTVGGTAA